MIFLLVCLLPTCSGEIFNIRMNGASIKEDDSIVCMVVPFDVEEAYFTKPINRFSTNVHHLALTGLESIDSTPTNVPLKCSEVQSTGQFTFLFIIGGASNFEETQNHDSSFKSGTAARGGSKFKVNFIEVQFHYQKATPYLDYSGIDLEYTTEPIGKILGAAAFILDGVAIPPGKIVNLDGFCSYPSNHTVSLAQIVAHTHQIATLTSIYLVRDNKWIPLRKVDMRKPGVGSPGISLRIKR